MRLQQQHQRHLTAATPATQAATTTTGM